MLTKLSLRLRVFLFFALLGVGSVAIIAASLAFAASRIDPANPAAALATGGIIAAFLCCGMVLAVWRLFDEHVAKAVERIAAVMRARAHADARAGHGAVSASYLGDIAPAAEALSEKLAAERATRADTIAERTAEMQAQTEQLTALFSDVQSGLILCSPTHQIVFYNAPAVELLQDTGRPRLDRSIFDLLRRGPIQRTYDRLVADDETEGDADLLVATTRCGRTIGAHMRLVTGALGIGARPGYVLTLRDVSADLKLHTERERLLSDTLDALREPAAGLRALLDVRAEDGTDTPSIDAALLAEAQTLAHAVAAIAERHDAHQDTWWPMQNVRASHLIDALRGQLGPEGPTLDAPTPHLRLRCDGFAIVNLMAGLVEAVSDRAGVRTVAIQFLTGGPGATLRIAWVGAPMRLGDLDALLDEPARDAPLSITGREILDHHNTDMWPEVLPDGRSALVLPLPEAEEMASPSRHVGTKAERPTVFDFDLLNQVRDGTKEGKRLSELTYVVFDTETTGLDPKGGDEIVQIAAVRLLNGRRVDGEILDMLVDPERSIPPVSTKVHGISEDMVRGAPTIREAGARFHRFCENAVLVAHNAPFDMAFFHRHADAIGARFDHPVFDTVLLSAILFGQSETHTLDALADRLGVVIPEADRHTALGDTLATADVFQKMLAMLEARGLATFDDVLAEMQRNSRLLREMTARVS